MANKYNATTRNIKQKKLNVPALLKAKALRVTVPGPGVTGKKGKKYDAPDKFSVVTPKNRQAKGWEDKPNSYRKAEKLMDKGWLDDGKYRQIVDSAKAKGLPRKRIFKEG